MTAPRWVYAPAIIALAILGIPLLALLSDVPWPEIPRLLGSTEGAAALWLSVKTSLVATLIIVVIGIPLAIALSRAGRFAPALRVLVVVPMTMPPVVGGLALLSAFGRRSWIGSTFPAIGEFFAFSTASVILAQIFVGLPFLVLSTESALKSLDVRYVEAARGLGAGRNRTLFQVILPLIAPSVLSGTALAMARALGEFGATLTFAGSMPGITRTMPLAIYLEREAQPELALALAAILLGLATFLVALSGVTPWLLAKARSGRRQALPDIIELPPAVAPPQTVTVDDRTLKFSGWTTVIGPNGAGKTTLLRRLRPRLRDAIILTQYPALFPNMTVLENVRFACRDRVRAWSELAAVGATDLAHRYPSEISGGQAARVSLARALAASPQILLLDEPLAAVDASSASMLRDVLRTRLSDIPVLMVTHDPVDVALLADQLLVVEDGQITQSGVPARILAAPSSSFVAEFAGLCALSGVVTQVDEVVTLTCGSVEVQGQTDVPLSVDESVTALFSPRAVSVEPPGVQGKSSSRNALPGTVAALSHHGSYVRVVINAGGGQFFADVTPHSASELKLTPGSSVIARLKALQVRVVPGVIGR
ncbi:ATP-binding cassette domain-containing protein [Corynebacterium sp. H130]|uniref:ATP-binding cassette domain-containing protein n=1 Tax=Corynebacterium sp. H130 TaxID=3133444 RepID=UPI003094CE78